MSGRCTANGVLQRQRTDTAHIGPGDPGLDTQGPDEQFCILFAEQQETTTLAPPALHHALLPVSKHSAPFSTLHATMPPLPLEPPNHKPCDSRRPTKQLQHQPFYLQTQPALNAPSPTPVTDPLTLCPLLARTLTLAAPTKLLPCTALHSRAPPSHRALQPHAKRRTPHDAPQQLGFPPRARTPHPCYLSPGDTHHRTRMIPRSSLTTAHTRSLKARRLSLLRSKAPAAAAAAAATACALPAPAGPSGAATSLPSAAATWDAACGSAWDCGTNRVPGV